jgi:hypothetical protein
MANKLAPSSQSFGAEAFLFFKRSASQLVSMSASQQERRLTKPDFLMSSWLYDDQFVWQTHAEMLTG